MSILNPNSPAPPVSQLEISSHLDHGSHVEEESQVSHVDSSSHEPFSKNNICNIKLLQIMLNKLKLPNSRSVMHLSGRSWLSNSFEFFKSHCMVSRGPTDVGLTLFAIGYFAICSYVTCLSNAVVDRINPNNLIPQSQRSVLVDPGMNWAYHLFIRTGLPHDLSDVFVRLSGALIVVRCLTLRERSLTVLRRALYVAGTVYLLRAPTVLMTVLPNPLIEVRPEISSIAKHNERCIFKLASSSIF
jgi:hypothetical protein